MELHRAELGLFEVSRHSRSGQVTTNKKFQDLPRAEVKSTIDECGEAILKVLVITGDFCSKIGLLYEAEELRGKSFTMGEVVAVTLDGVNEAYLESLLKLFSSVS
ncbi:hypothetical protein CTI12_AA499170 [Artemisia annua]|uniref:Uncharacterized protein n=1 Tax=Artemisia annua TaxID=35608 RepID=A0A2U1LE72_ARTAN|nr:hypothetical protein CTI12_AA499170 [Artemisia annua]